MAFHDDAGGRKQNRDPAEQPHGGDEDKASWTPSELAHLMKLTTLTEDELKEIVRNPRLRQAWATMLSESHRYHTLVETSPEAVGITIAGRIEYLNPAAVRLLGGASAEDLKGMEALDLAHPEDRERITEWFRTQLSSPTSTPSLQRWVTLDGRNIWMESVAGQVQYNGRPAWQIRARDVTADVEAKAKIKESEQHALKLAARMKAVAEAAGSILGAREVEELDAVLRSACDQVLPHDVFTFGLYDEARHALRFVAGWDGPLFVPGGSVALEATPSEWVVRERQPLVTGTSQDERGRGAQLIGTGRRSESSIRVPVLHGSRVLGVISVQSYIPNLYSKDDAEVLQVFASVAATALVGLELQQEQDRTAQALRESEERYRLATLASRDVIWERNLLTGKSHWGGSMEEVFGYSFDEVEATSQWWSERIHPDDRDAATAAVAAAMESQDSYWSGEYRFLRSNGTYAYVADHALIQRDPDGTAVRMVGAMHDQTESRRTLRALAEQEQTLSALMNNLPGLVYRCKNDENWTTEFVSEGCRGLTGYSPAELERIGFNAAIHPEDRTAVFEQVQAALASGDAFNLEYRVITATGEVKWVWEQGHALRDADGAVTALEGLVLDISPQVRTEQELRQSEERFREVMETIPAVFWSFTSNFEQTLYISPAFEEVWGRAISEIYENPTSFLDQVVSEDLPAMQEAMAGVREGFQDVEYRIRRGDGEVRWVRSRGLPIKDDSGETIRLIGTTEDVTEKRRAAEALVESELRFRQVAENVRDVFWVTDLDLREMLYVSPAYEQIWGYTCAHLYKNPRAWIDAVHPDDLPSVVAAALDARARGFDLEYRIRTAAGEIRWIHDRGFPVRDESGDVYRIAGIAEDVTESKAAARRLEETEARYRRLVETVAQTLWRADAEGSALAERGLWGDFTGQSPAEMQGTGWIQAVHPDDQPRTVEAWQEAIASKQVFQLEHRIRRADGKFRWMIARAVPLLDSEGEVAEWVGIHTDVTQQKNMEDHLRQAMKMEAVGQLAGGIAHDFRNLLHVIKGNVQMLMMEHGDTSHWKEQLKDIENAASRATALTGRLLAYSRRQALQARALDPNALINETERLLRRLIPERIEVRTDLSANIGHVSVDPTQLQQVLINLAANARDAIADVGSITISSTRTELGESDSKPWYVPSGCYVEVRVSDTGCGMTEEIMDQMFEPFFTTKEVGKGTGFGLATAYGIIKQSGGYIWAESEVGVGSEFIVLLPECDPPEEEEPGQSVERVEQEGKGRVLIVEDQEEVRRLVRNVLEKAGYTTIEASDGEQGIAAAEDSGDELRLIVSDVVMPRMSGPEMARRLRENGHWTPILFMSGHPGDELRELQEFGAEVLMKPFSSEELTSAVGRATLKAAG